MSYAILKAIHVGAATLSGLRFFARGLGVLAHAPWIRTRVACSIPHVVDTVLLTSALALAWTLHVSPLATPWLGAKLVGLFAYIGLGLVAPRFGRSNAVRGTAWITALLVFGYIVSVAIANDPRGLFAPERWELRIGLRVLAAAAGGG